MIARPVQVAAVILLTWAAQAATVQRTDAIAKLRVLLLSGQNNHDWRETTPRIEQILEESGRFTVDVTDHPEQVTRETLQSYDVVVSNWNAFHRGDPPAVVDWPEATRQAFLDFVRGGRGFVVIHAGSSSFYDWPAYHVMAIARYGFDQTGHSVRHTFPVRIEKSDHPITGGMRDFVIHDELWHNASVVPAATVLASAFSAKDTGGSGKQEPVVFVRPFGEGRSFTILLGHDLRPMRHPAFCALLCRGAEWAATGAVTLPLPTRWPPTPAAVATLDTSLEDALKAIRSYQFGQDRTPLQVVEASVHAAGDDPQQRQVLADHLAAMASGEASAECKRFICKQLACIGSAEHVSALAPLLRDPQLTVAARGALEMIPGPEASAALRDLLQTSDGALRVGAIQSLMRRRDREAVPLIAPLMNAEDRNTRAAAIAALGHIGGGAARDALLGAKRDLPADCKRIWADAILRCAERLWSEGNRAAAQPLCDALVTDELPDYIRIAALTRQLVCVDQPDDERLWSALADDDPAFRAAALRALREYGSPRQLAGLAARLEKLPDEFQRQAIPMLASRRISAALPAITRAADHPAAGVRREALVALGTLGDASTVAVLLARLDDASPAETRVIAHSLTRLRGESVNARMIGLAVTAKPDHARALIKALVARKAGEAVPTLLELVRRDDPELADEAVRALGELGDVDVSNRLIALLAEPHRAASPDAIRRALVQVSRRLSGDPARPTLTALVTADDALATELMPVLSTLAGSAALQAVCERTSARDDDLRLAAIHALAEWADPAALEPLLEVARAAKLPREKTLALRGFARLLPLAEQMPQNQRAVLLERAIHLAERPDEKKALLSCAPCVPSGRVLQWVGDCLAAPEITGEASLAALSLADSLEHAHPKLASVALRRILNLSTDQTIRSEAFRRLCQLGKLVNLALAAKADSPDDLKPDFDGQEAHAAIDGDPGTYWDEQNDQSVYRLRLSFDDPATVAAITITGYRHHDHAPRGFLVVCDERQIAEIQDATYSNNYLAITFPETLCTTLELVITAYYGRSPAIRELGIYGGISKAPDQNSMQPEWRRTDSTLTLLNHGRPVWTFNYGAGLAKPYFHPVALVDGTVLTWDAPPDHPWHHGHWFSWKYVNGLNYWEESRETGESDGRTTIRGVEITSPDDHTARIQMTLHYGRPGAKPVLIEERLIEVSAPNEAGRYHLDWTMTFRAGMDEVVLDRTPLSHEKGGKIWGGYAGLAFRLAKGLQELQAVSSKGEVTEWKNQRHRSKATAMEYHGLIDGRPAGVAILDHPENLNAPSPWYLINSDVMTYINPAVICFGPHTLPAGESLTLRYRTIIHPGYWDASDLRREYNRFVRTK
ncbi:MAG: DUF6807 family protein [Phycisphaerae bacterium]